MAHVLDAEVETLLGAARRGDAAAQASLFQAHKSRVAHQILRMTGDAASVDDLVQEVFISAFHRLDRFRGEAQLETWLHRIAVNKVRNWWDSQRRRAARERAGSSRVTDLVASPEGHAEAHERVARLYDALGQLPDKFREAFVARAIEGLSLDDASEQLGVPVSTVSYRARRAEVLLCEALGLEAPQ